MPTKDPMWICRFCGKVYSTANRIIGLCDCKDSMQEKFKAFFSDPPVSPIGMNTSEPVIVPTPTPVDKSEWEDIGVIVGRFQSPYLHQGYRELLDIAVKRHRRVFVFLGVSPLKTTMHDPFDFKIRFDMIRSAYPSVEIYKIDDVGDVERWSRSLDYHIAQLAGPTQSVILYGSRDCFPYSGRYEREIITPSHDISSTTIRRAAGIVSINSEDFRNGVVRATQNRWPICYPTVDIAVLDFKNNRLLCGKKRGDTLWRFPGGFADVNSDSYEEDALRELKEETTLIGKSINYIGSKKIDDWRYRHQTDKIKTLFYVVTDWEGNPKASDDLAHVEWQDLDSLAADSFLPNHRTLFIMMLNWKNRLTKLASTKESS